MKNIKGFTLVELLAVIIILAIVALVTTPAILNVINNARRSGAEDKAWGTIDAVRLAYVQSQTIDNANEVDVDINGNIIVDFNANREIGGRNITVNGEMPDSGTVKINIGIRNNEANGTGRITCTNLKFENNGKYTCSTNTEGTKMCCLTGNNEPTKNECKRAYKDWNDEIAS